MHCQNNKYNRNCKQSQRIDYRLYRTEKKYQRGFGLVIVVIVLVAIIGLALSVLSADINQNIALVEQSRTDAQNHSLLIAEETYRLNPRATDVDTNSPFNIDDLCDIVSTSFLSDAECVASPTVGLYVGRDGVVRYSSLALAEDGQEVPFGVVDGEVIQLQARAELQHQLRRVASVLENYHYQQSLLNLGGNSSSKLLHLGGGVNVPQDNYLSCAYTKSSINPNSIIHCEDSLEPIPITTGVFTNIDQKTVFNTTVVYQTDGVVTLNSAFGDDGLVVVSLNAPDQNIAGIVAAETPWPRAVTLGGNHFEWVFVRKIQVNE